MRDLIGKKIFYVGSTRKKMVFRPYVESGHVRCVKGFSQTVTTEQSYTDGKKYSRNSRSLSWIGC